MYGGIRNINGNTSRRTLDYIITIVIILKYDVKWNIRPMLATFKSYSCTGYFLCYYSICMLMHQTKVPANNELGVPIISFLQETNSQALTCSFTIAVEEPRKLFAWRYWNSIMKCLLLTLVWNSLMNIYEKKMLCTKISCKKSCNSAWYICSSWPFIACIFHHQI